MPKSMTLMCPCDVTMTLAGLTSRCTRPCSMREAQRFGHLASDAHGVRELQRSLLQDGSQRLALDVFHDEEHLPVLVLDELVDLADERMIERGRQSRLARQPVHDVGCRRATRTNRLDGDDPAQLAILRAIDLAHAALTDELLDHVAVAPEIGRAGPRRFVADVVGLGDARKQRLHFLLKLRLTGAGFAQVGGPIGVSSTQGLLQDAICGVGLVAVHQAPRFGTGGLAQFLNTRAMVARVGRFYAAIPDWQQFSGRALQWDASLPRERNDARPLSRASGGRRRNRRRGCLATATLPRRDEYRLRVCDGAG